MKELLAILSLPAMPTAVYFAGYQGLRMQEAVLAWNTNRISKVVMIVRFVATLLVPLQFAILLGMALSIVLHVFRESNKVVVTQ